MGLSRRAVMAAGVAIVSSTLLTTPAHAATVITVTPSQSIQAAVDSASPGDTIQLTAGTFHQEVTITKNGITLKGTGSGVGGTVLQPPSAFPSDYCAITPPVVEFTHGSGICVFGQFDQTTGTITSFATNDSISDIRLENFPGDGVVAFGTVGLRVTNLNIQHTAAYGIALLASSNGALTGNTIQGIVDGGGAALFAGYLPNSHFVISNNVFTNTQIGAFLYDVGDVVFTNNTVSGTCAGVWNWDDNLPGDGQPVGYGNNLIAANTLTNNSAYCPAVPGEGQPAVQGEGILLQGPTNTVVSANVVTGSIGNGTVSTPTGGIVVLTGTTIGGLPESDVTVVGNVVTGNGPNDLYWDGNGTRVTIAYNVCHTSSPSRLCS